MTYRLIIDNRESHLIDCLKNRFPNMEFEVESLDLADIQLFKDEQPICFIERKTLQDLTSSIKDGRYREQKARLLSHRKEYNTRLLYIFEGTRYSKRLLSASTLLSCCVNTAIRDNIAVHRTIDLNGTADYIARIMHNIPKWNLSWETPTETTQVDYANTIKSKKKDNLTPGLCFMRQLATVPGVSATMAHEIKEVYGSMSTLIMAYLSIEDNEPARQNLLADIKINGRRLGKVRSTRIYHYLCGESDQNDQNDQN